MIAFGIPLARLKAIGERYRSLAELSECMILQALAIDDEVSPEELEGFVQFRAAAQMRAAAHASKVDFDQLLDAARAMNAADDQALRI